MEKISSNQSRDKNRINNIKSNISLLICFLSSLKNWKNMENLFEKHLGTWCLLTFQTNFILSVLLYFRSRTYIA